MQNDEVRELFEDVLAIETPDIKAPRGFFLSGWGLVTVRPQFLRSARSCWTSCSRISSNQRGVVHAVSYSAEGVGVNSRCDGKKQLISYPENYVGMANQRIGFTAVLLPLAPVTLLARRLPPYEPALVECREIATCLFRGPPNYDSIKGACRHSERKRPNHLAQESFKSCSGDTACVGE